ncbi:hypothetical protein BLOT_010849 [Blomia tropicalis]|nr:hypothetical protein BLOT_010849 [Blomia tropicalis]
MFAIRLPADSTSIYADSCQIRPIKSNTDFVQYMTPPCTTTVSKAHQFDMSTYQFKYHKTKRALVGLMQRLKRIFPIGVLIPSVVAGRHLEFREDTLFIPGFISIYCQTLPIEIGQTVVIWVHGRKHVLKKSLYIHEHCYGANSFNNKTSNFIAKYANVP